MMVTDLLQVVRYDTIVVVFYDTIVVPTRLVQAVRNKSLYYTRKNLTTCQQDVFATGL
jgi:hypothetical protein